MKVASPPMMLCGRAGRSAFPKIGEQDQVGDEDPAEPVIVQVLAQRMELIMALLARVLPSFLATATIADLHGRALEPDGPRIMPLDLDHEHEARHVRPARSDRHASRGRNAVVG